MCSHAISSCQFASRQSAPRCPAVATVDIALFQAATPGPASSRQTSRCESSVLVSPTSHTHSSPAHFCLQYNTASASAPKLGSLSGSSLLAFVFFFFHSLPVRRSIDQLSPYPSSPLFEPPSGPRRRLQGCRPASFHHLLYGISQTRPVQRLHRCPNGSHNLATLFFFVPTRQFENSQPWLAASTPDRRSHIGIISQALFFLACPSKYFFVSGNQFNREPRQLVEVRTSRDGPLRAPWRVSPQNTAQRPHHPLPYTFCIPNRTVDTLSAAFLLHLAIAALLGTQPEHFKYFYASH